MNHVILPLRPVKRLNVTLTNDQQNQTLINAARPELRPDAQLTQKSVNHGEDLSPTLIHVLQFLKSGIWSIESRAKVPEHL